MLGCSPPPVTTSFLSLFFCMCVFEEFGSGNHTKTNSCQNQTEIQVVFMDAFHRGVSPSGLLAEQKSEILGWESHRRGKTTAQRHRWYVLKLPEMNMEKTSGCWCLYGMLLWMWMYVDYVGDVNFRRDYDLYELHHTWIFSRKLGWMVSKWVIT